MAMRRKGIVFSVVAIFICLIIVALAYLLIGNGVFSLNNDYYQARLLFLNSELKYFENTYLPQSLQFASYNCLYYMVGFYSENLSLCNGNYSCFRNEFYDCVINGSVDGVNLSGMRNRTLTYFVKGYLDQEKKNGLNMSVNFDGLNISERVPYYIDVNISYRVLARAVDNLSSWNNSNINSIRFSVYDIPDPLWKYEIGVDLPLKSAEYYSALGSVDKWNEFIFNESLSNSYAYSYKNSYLEYTLGNSFLGRMINYSFPVLSQAMGLWSFDYDFSDGVDVVFDSSFLRDSGILLGDTKVAYSFDKGTVNLASSKILDLSGYRNNASFNGVLITNLSCVAGDCLEFEPGNNISTSLSVNLGNKFSIALWIKPLQNNTFLFEKEGDLRLMINDSRLLLEGFNGTSWNKIKSNSSIGVGVWTSVIVGYNNGSEVFYVNGIKDPFRGNFVIENSTSKLVFGGNPGFNGSMDEIGIYTRFVNSNGAREIFNRRKVYFVDYVNSKFGEGVDFENEGRFVEVPVNFSLGKHYTISFWLYPFNSSFNISDRQGVLILKNLSDGLSPWNNEGLRFFLNGHGKLEWDIYPGEIGNLQSNFTVNGWNYFVAVFDGTLAKLYWNGRIVNEAVCDMRKTNLKRIYLPFMASTHFLKGIVDEVKIYNRSLTDRDIENSYLNYNSFGKGLDRYVILVNPNRFGFNKVAFRKNVSYSDVLFFKYWNLSKRYNYTLFNLTNFTSYNVWIPYYNFLLDECMMEAFNVFDWDTKTGIVHVGNDSANCVQEIYNGWY